MSTIRLVNITAIAEHIQLKVIGCGIYITPKLSFWIFYIIILQCLLYFIKYTQIISFVLYFCGYAINSKGIHATHLSIFSRVTSLSYNSKVHGSIMGPIWGRQDPGGPHVGSMNFAIWVVLFPQQWAAQTTCISSHVMTNNFLVYSKISQILPLYKTWGIITNLTLRNSWGYITDMSKYHNAGIWSMD